MQVGEKQIFRYSNAYFIDHPELESTILSTQVSRFYVGISEIYPTITESLPDEVFDWVKTPSHLFHLLGKFGRWVDHYLLSFTNPSYWGSEVFPQDTLNELEAQFQQVLVETGNFWDSDYYPATQWLSDRTLDTDFIETGPSVYFFRNRDLMRIIWLAETEEDGAPIWQAPFGSFDLSFEDFEAEVRQFMQQFSETMTQRIHTITESNADIPSLQKMLNIQTTTTDSVHKRLLPSLPPPTEWDVVRSRIAKLT